MLSLLRQRSSEVIVAGLFSTGGIYIIEFMAELHMVYAALGLTHLLMGVAEAIKHSTHNSTGASGG